ncbi:MAG: GNAT family N-acetyltransferase [Gemmataceae bacterium]
MHRDWRPPTLQTTRLIVRPIVQDDVDSIFAYACNPAVTRFTLWDRHRDRNDSLEFVRDYAFLRYVEKQPDPLAICQKEEPGRVLGTVGCFWNARANRTMEMGYALAEEHWGRGFVVEAAGALLDHVFAAYEVERVQARCMVENAASTRVMQKLGMKFEGCLRSSLFHRERFWDMNLYAILRCEWRR